jgi:hypothetical protein
LIRSATSLHPFSQALAPDGEGGAFVFWRDERSPGLFAQHLSSSGTALWRADGVPVAQLPFVIQGQLVAVSDGSGGAIVAWAGNSQTGSGLYVARVNRGGGMPWHADVPVLNASPAQTDFRMVPVTGGGAILSWRDTCGGAGGVICAQRISHGGKTLWRTNGVPVSTASSHKDYLAMAADERRGAYIAWGDTRSEGEVFAMHLDESGEPFRGWSRNGSPICARIAQVFSVDLTADGDGGAIVAWTDARCTPDSLCGYPVCLAMKLGRNGPAVTPVSPAPVPELERRPEPVRAQSTPSPTFSLRGLEPNPGSRGSLLRFSLPDASPAALELFDIAGRRLWSRDLSAFGTGQHSVMVGDGAWFPPGVYLVRLTQGQRVASARIALIR